MPRPANQKPNPANPQPSPDELLALAERLERQAWARSGVQLMKSLGMEPDPWQINLLRSEARRLLLCCSRQSGKSTTTAVLALHHALYPSAGKPTLTLLLSPSQRQSSELFRKVLTYYRQLGRPEPSVEENKLSIELTNGSRVISLPSAEETIRGYSGVTLLVIDEAARVPDELYRSVRPMLATSGGRLICLSTPFGRRGFFYEEWISERPWERIRIPAELCPRIPAEFLAEERLSLGEMFYRQEYLCDFTAAHGLVYPEFESCIINPCPIKAARAFAGCDFGWHNRSCFLVCVLDTDDVLYVVEEIYQDQMTDEELAVRAYALVRKWGIERVWCDSASPQSIEKLKRGNVPACPAFKALGDGIRAVGARIRTGRLKCWRTCKNLIREMSLYRFDRERALPTDNPVKEHDHSPDSLRYACSSLDRTKHPHGMVQPPPEPEPEPAPDYERDYTKAPVQQRYKTVEERYDESDEARRLNHQHLWDNTFDSASGANW
jgi:hypothetical protein